MVCDSLVARSHGGVHSVPGFTSTEPSARPNSAGTFMANNDYVLTMARYNMWQNESLVRAADTLTDEARHADRGAFFGSIQRTFSHVLWGDRIWISRFSKTPPPKGGIPESVELYTDWVVFKRDRAAFDREILGWARTLDRGWFDGDLSWYSGAMERHVTKPKSILSMHFFNHQTHHRGQIHAMLTAAGARPDDTDVPFMPDRYANL